MSPVDLFTSEGRVAIGERSKEEEGDHDNGAYRHQREVVEGEEDLGPPGDVGGKGEEGVHCNKPSSHCSQVPPKFYLAAVEKNRFFFCFFLCSCKIKSSSGLKTRLSLQH